MMKIVFLLGVILLLCISDVFGSGCPRTNRKARSQCVDECQRSRGCSDSKKKCVCDGNCGYSCVKKGLQCSVLRKPRNGKIVGKDRSFNSTLKFRCDPQYTLFGSSSRRCTAKGLWDGKKARCKISCPDPGVHISTVRNKKKNSLGFPERTTLRYDCLPGYTTTDTLTIKCQKNKRWSSQAPVCKVKQCGRANLPSNSYVRIPRPWKNRATHKLGTRLLLSCTPGYRSIAIVGSFRCLSSGWKLQSPNFVCKAKSCGNPGTPRDGTKIGLAYTFNEIVRYTCNNCFKLRGASYRQCLADGTWSDSLPSCERVTCPYPDQVAHGTLSLSSRPIYCNSYVEYTCAIGYELKGVSKRTCLGDGTWSDRKPKCELVNCGDPGHPRNGRTTAPSGFTYGEDITFTCDQNYVLEGSSLATCQRDGTWSKILPKCLEKCSDPSRYTNAFLRGDQFYHGKQVQFSCRRDFTLVPSRSWKLTCNDGNWNGKIPLCKAPCPRLPQLSNGRKSSNSLRHGTSVKFSCSYGHRLVGPSSTKCDDGNWSSSMPRCLAICSRINSISDGWVDGKGYLEGDVLKFRCRRDYILEGEKSIKCMGNRRWNATKPKCNAPCRRLSRPNDGKVVQQGFRHNENVEFECDKDYVLEGRRSLTCLDGRWNGGVPKCLAPCKHFADPPFPGGRVTKHGFRHNEDVRFDCTAPFVIDGKSTLTCNEGAWDGKPPKCGEPCKKFDVPKNGVIIQNRYKHKDATVFGCKRGFQLIGIKDRWCNFGVWNDPRQPQCEEKCPDPNGRTNARVLGSDFYNGKEVEFSCSNGDILVPASSKKLKCENGKWNDKIPLCAASCQHLPRIPHGNVVVRSLTHGSKAHFNCDRNYQLLGAKSAQCDDGKWSNNVPKCSAFCSKISSIKDGTVNGKGRLAGSEISFTCDPNFILDGEGAIKCMDTGKWNASMPTCKMAPTTGSTQATTTTTATTTTSTTSTSTASTSATQASNVRTSPVPTTTAGKAQVKNCPDIKKIRKGQMQGFGVRPGSKRTFSCIKNWVLSGAKEITCLKTGLWSPAQPRCIPKGPVINCPIVSPIKGGYSITNQSFHGGRVVFKCNTNYVMTGKPGTLCRSGKWVRNPPKCNAPCPTLGSPINGYTAWEDGRRHGDKIWFGCFPGYTMKGASVLQCDNGKWNHPLPACQK